MIATYAQLPFKTGDFHKTGGMNITKWDKGGLLKIWFVIHWFYFFRESLWKVKETDSRWNLNRRIDARFELDRGGILSCKILSGILQMVASNPSIIFQWCLLDLVGMSATELFHLTPFFGDARSIYSANPYEFPGPKGIADCNTTHRMFCIVVPQWIPAP